MNSVMFSIAAIVSLLSFTFSLKQIELSTNCYENTSSRNHLELLQLFMMRQKMMNRSIIMIATGV